MNISAADISGPALGLVCAVLVVLFAFVRPRKVYAGGADALALLPLLAGFVYAAWCTTERRQSWRWRRTKAHRHRWRCRSQGHLE